MGMKLAWANPNTRQEEPDAYWQIIGPIQVDFGNRTANFGVAVWKSQDVREEAKTQNLADPSNPLLPVYATHIAISNLAASETSDGKAHNEYDLHFGNAKQEEAGWNIQKACYAALKASRHRMLAPFGFADAADVP